MDLSIGDKSVHIDVGETWQQNRELRRSVALLRKDTSSNNSTQVTASPQGSGLSPTLKRQIGLAIGIPLGVILLIAIGLFLLWRRRKSRDREIARISYETRSEKRRSKQKSKTGGTGSSTHSFQPTPLTAQSFPSPTSGDELTALPPIGRQDRDELTALPPIARRQKTPEKPPPTSHSILSDLAFRPSIRSLTRKVSGNFKNKRDDDVESGGVSRTASKSSTRRGDTPTRHPSQRELYYQNMREAEAKGTLPDRTASPLPGLLAGGAIPRAGSPTAGSVLSDSVVQRPLSPNFDVSTEVARHEAHMSLLEERRAIAERYAQLMDERTGASSPPPPVSVPRSPSLSRTERRDRRDEETLPGGFVVPESSKAHTRRPSRQNAAQQAYQAQYYENPTSAGAPTAGHNLETSLAPSFGQHSPYRVYSPANVPRSTPSPNPYGRGDMNKSLPETPRLGSSHSRGQSSPMVSPSDTLSGSHRRARSHEQSGAGRGSVRAALNELRSQGIGVGTPPPPGGLSRNPSTSERKQGKKPSWDLLM